MSSAADESSIINTVISVITLLISSASVLILQGYYSSILFTNRNLVTYLYNFIIHVIFSIILFLVIYNISQKFIKTYLNLQNLSMLCFNFFGPLNSTFSLLSRILIFFLLLMFDFIVITIAVIRQIIVLKVHRCCILYLCKYNFNLKILS